MNLVLFCFCWIYHQVSWSEIFWYVLFEELHFVIAVSTHPANDIGALQIYKSTKAAWFDVVVITQMCWCYHWSLLCFIYAIVVVRNSSRYSGAQK